MKCSLISCIIKHDSHSEPIFDYVPWQGTKLSFIIEKTGCYDDLTVLYSEEITKEQYDHFVEFQKGTAKDLVY